jgi:hypothetical protein
MTGTITTLGRTGSACRAATAGAEVAITAIINVRLRMSHNTARVATLVRV